MRSGTRLDSLLAARLGRDADRPALASGERTLSYAELDAAVQALRERLTSAAGTARGEEAALAGARVAVVAPNVPAFAVAAFAAWAAGAVVVPLSARLREYELGRALEDAEASVAVAVASHGGYSYADVLPGLLPRLSALGGCIFVDEAGEVTGEAWREGRAAQTEALEHEIAAILYTSGTAGDPKGALVTHASERRSASAMAEVLGLSPHDATALVIPASHAFGLACLLAAIASGGLAVLVESAFSLDPLLRAVARHGPTVLHGSPSLFSGVLKGAPESLAGVRAGFVGGAPCPPDLLAELDGAGARILNMFGMTEIGAAACCRADDPPQVRYTTVGRPLEGYEFRTAAAEGGDGSVGELQVRGPHVTPGYHRRPELTAEAFDGEWFRTGDLGSIDGEGHVTIAGRAKEVVHVGGFSVFPAEVENFLLTHPDVAQAAVVGVPHERMGEGLKAFVVPRPGCELSPSALLRFARPRIAGYKLPYAIDVVAELPLLPSGKPDRAALGDAGAAGTPASARA